MCTKNPCTIRGLCAACAVFFICFPIWSLEVSGRGSVQNDIFSFKNGYQGSERTAGPGKNVITTAVFDAWDMSDNDIWISEDWDIGGFRLNLSFDRLGSADLSKTGIPLIDEWAVWIRPVDAGIHIADLDKILLFSLYFMAVGEDNRQVNRYNDIIDETETGWGGLQLGSTEADLTWGVHAASSDDDVFKGYIICFDTNLFKIDIAFNSGIMSNDFILSAPAMSFGGESSTGSMGAGVRLLVPIEGLFTLSSIAKLVYTPDADLLETNMAEWSASIIFDITSIRNLDLAFGYFAHWYPEESLTGVFNPLDPDGDWRLGTAVNTFSHAIDFRTQYKSGAWGLALHNNATFALRANAAALLFADKLNLGILYEMGASASFITEIQNYVWLRRVNEQVSAFFDTVTIYPRFTFSAFSDRIRIKCGLRFDFEVMAEGQKMSVQTEVSGGGIVNTYTIFTKQSYIPRLHLAIPFSLEVLF